MADAKPPGSPAHPQASGGKKRTIRVIEIAVSLVIIVGVFAYFVPSIANYSDVWATIKALTWLELGTLIGATLLNILTYWIQMVAFLPGLTLGQAAVNNQSSTSIANTLPGGGAIAIGVAYAMFRSWGFKDSEVVLFTLNTGVWNMFLKLGLPILALALLAATGGATAALLAPALIGLAALIGAVACFALMLWKKRFAFAVGTALGRAATGLRKLSGSHP